MNNSLFMSIYLRYLNSE